MTEVARKDWWKIAIVAVIAIEVLGGASGWLSNSGYGNDWFDNLVKPSFMPPGAAFGIVWPMGCATFVPTIATGITGEPDSSASLATPVLPR